MSGDQEEDDTQEPELPGVPPPPDREIKKTLLGRTVFQFESYLVGPELQQHFATHDYLKGLATEKKEAFARLNGALGRSIILSFLLACYISGIRFDVKIFDYEVLQFPAFVEVVSLLAAFAILQVILSFLDFFMVDRILNYLSGSRLKIDSPVYGYAHYNSFGIWADIFTIRAAGYESSLAHKGVVVIFAGYIFLYGLVFLTFAVGTIFYAFYFVVVEGHTTWWIFTAMSWVGAAVALVGLFIFVVALLIRFKFTIPPDVYAAMRQKQAEAATVSDGSAT